MECRENPSISECVVVELVVQIRVHLLAGGRGCYEVKQAGEKLV
jgi:hypothetical protein